MASKSAGNRPDWSTAVAHLRRCDPVMRKVIAAVGECTLAPRRDHFVVLCKSIYTQQISTAVAAVLFSRFRNCFPLRRPTPQRTLELLSHEGAWRGCGLSRQKRSYLIDLAAHFVNGRIPRRLSVMGDEAVIDALVAVKGIGRWTAEMFLIFTLNRPDVLPVDDLGLQTALRDAYRLPERPKAAELRALAEPWRPYRTIATWYLWRWMAAQAAAKPRRRPTRAAR